MLTDDDSGTFGGLAQRHQSSMGGRTGADISPASPPQRPPRPASSAFSAPVEPEPARRTTRAGFEAGVARHRPRHRGPAPPIWRSSAIGRNQTTRQTALGTLPDMLYDAGADVIFQVAGRSGVGVFDAASGLARNRRWAIGVETDQWQACDHTTTTPHPDVDRQTFRRADLRDHRGLSRWQPRSRRAPTQRRRRSVHLRAGRATR